MGGYKPHFKSYPADYYPSSACDVVLMAIFVLFVVLGSLGIMVGFLYWEFAVGIKSFVDVWVIVHCISIGLMLIGIYFGGSQKLTQEKLMIKQKI